MPMCCLFTLTGLAFHPAAASSPVFIKGKSTGTASTALPQAAADSSLQPATQGAETASPTPLQVLQQLLLLQAKSFRVC